MKTRKGPGNELNAAEKLVDVAVTVLAEVLAEMETAHRSGLKMFGCHGSRYRVS